jgi:hypothetical protein
MLGAHRDFVFQLAATDLNGNRTTFAMPLLFVGVEANQSDAIIAEIIKRYDAEARPRRTASFGNHPLCYAPLSPGSLGDPQLPTGSVTFRAAGVTQIPKAEARFYPEISDALAGIAEFRGRFAQPDALVEVAYPET